MSNKHVHVIEPTPFAFESVTVATDATTNLNASYVGSSKAVFITVETSSIRYRIDGQDAASDSGHLIENGLALCFENTAAIRHFSCIAIANESELSITYYR